MTPHRDCLLYVDVDDRDLLLDDLCEYMEAEREKAVLTVPGLEVRVDRNEFGHEFRPESVFPEWPTVVEICPAEPAPADADLGEVVGGLVRRLRRRGHRVVAVYGDQAAPAGDDPLRPDRIERPEVQDIPGGRCTHHGRPVTGTVVDRWGDGTLRCETEMLAGVLDGRVRTYRENSRLSREDWYDAGQRVRERRWHPNGQLESDTRLLGDGPQTHTQRWTPEGRPDPSGP
jgi:hypothetical protein